MLCYLDKLGNLSYVDTLLGTCNVFGIFFEKGGSLGQPDGPVGTGACCQAWWPKINLQIHLVKEESWLLQVLLTSTYVPWPICVHAYTYIQHIHSINTRKIVKGSLWVGVLGSDSSLASASQEAGSADECCCASLTGCLHLLCADVSHWRAAHPQSLSTRCGV